MAKRNYTEEIKLLQERKEFESGLFNYRLSDLTQSLKLLMSDENSSTDELYKYLPIACVASIESFCRASVKALIEKEKYFDNVSDLANQAIQKFDFEVISALQHKHFTIGELVSHLLPCNNIAQLNHHLSKLLGYDFFAALKKYRPLMAGQYDDHLGNRFKKSYNSIIKSLEKTFELRHIFCHESGTLVSINRKEFEQDFVNCTTFLDMASNYIATLVYDNWTITVHDQVDILEKEFETKMDDLNKNIDKFRKHRSTDVEDKKNFYQQFDKTVRQWRKFAQTKADLAGIYSPSGLSGTYAYFKDYITSIEQFQKDVDYEK